MFGDSFVQTERCLCCDCHWKCKPNHVLPNVCQLLGEGRVCAVPGLVGLRSTGGWQRLWLCVQDWSHWSYHCGSSLSNPTSPSVANPNISKENRDIHEIHSPTQTNEHCKCIPAECCFREVDAVMWNCTQTKHRHTKPDKKQKPIVLYSVGAMTRAVQHLKSETNPWGTGILQHMYVQTKIYEILTRALKHLCATETESIIIKRKQIK